MVHFPARHVWLPERRRVHFFLCFFACRVWCRVSDCWWNTSRNIHFCRYPLTLCLLVYKPQEYSSDLHTINHSCCIIFTFTNWTLSFSGAPHCTGNHWNPNWHFRIRWHYHPDPSWNGEKTGSSCRFIVVNSSNSKTNMYHGIPSSVGSTTTYSW